MFNLYLDPVHEMTFVTFDLKNHFYRVLLI